MSEEWLNKFINKFHKKFIATLTSTQYKIPADSKQEATLKWIEVSIILNNTLEEIMAKEIIKKVRKKV
jgi:hypothetical protein